MGHSRKFVKNVIAKAKELLSQQKLMFPRDVGCSNPTSIRRVSAFKGPIRPERTEMDDYTESPTKLSDALAPAVDGV